MPQEPILLATELSARGDRPLDRAMLLAGQYGTRVKLVHVVETEHSASYHSDWLIAAIRQDIGERAETVDIDIRFGSPASQIAQAADEADAALIVTGIARLKSLGDHVLGTEVERILRRVTRPLLVVKRRADRPYRDILVTTDFSTPACHAFEIASALFPTADFTLLHVAPTVDGMDGSGEAMRNFIAKARIDPEIRKRLKSDIEIGDLVDKTAARVEQGHDLLVVGTQGQSALSRALIGSQARELLNSQAIDMLMIRPAPPAA